MDIKKYLLIIVFAVTFIGYGKMRVTQLSGSTHSPLELENIVALSSPEEDDCASKATRKYTEEKEVSETQCAVRGYLDYEVKRVDTYRECDFNPEGSICCDEETGLISSEVKSEVPVKCTHGPEQ